MPWLGTSGGAEISQNEVSSSSVMRPERALTVSPCLIVTVKTCSHKIFRGAADTVADSFNVNLSGWTQG